MINQPILQKLSDFEDKSLLIVDDDNPFRQRLARAMEKKGFTVTQAESVKVGIETVKSQSTAFAVVDLRLNEAIFEKDDKKFVIIDFNNVIREADEY